MPDAPPNPLLPILGLPTYSAAAEEARLTALLETAPQGLCFTALAAESQDSMITYGALFGLLTQSLVASVELPDGEVGYRRSARKQAGAAIAMVRSIARPKNCETIPGTRLAGAA